MAEGYLLSALVAKDADAPGAVVWSNGAMGLNAFWKSEDGAVTTDWVVLTASLVGIGVMVLGAVASGATALGDEVGVQVAAVATDDSAPAEMSACSLNDAGVVSCDDGGSGLID